MSLLPVSKRCASSAKTKKNTNSKRRTTWMVSSRWTLLFETVFASNQPGTDNKWCQTWCVSADNLKSNMPISSYIQVNPTLAKQNVSNPKRVLVRLKRFWLFPAGSRREARASSSACGRRSANNMRKQKQAKWTNKWLLVKKKTPRDRRISSPFFGVPVLFDPQT